jgi:hypothetical protein
MISPIEVSHNNVINRLRVIESATKALTKFTQDLDGQLETMRSIVTIDLSDVMSIYMLGVSTHMINYYENKSNALEDYWAFINSKNIIGLMDGCVRRTHAILQNLPDSYDKEKISSISDILAREDDYKIHINIQQSQSSICDCGGAISIYSDTSESKCRSCGRTSTIYGAIFDDTQIYNQDGQKSKQCRHYPSLHCKLWMTRIQAWAGPDIPQHVFDKLRTCLNRDRINLKKLRCKQLRKYLKMCGYSTYNNFIPYIRKILTNITPPQLDPEELNTLYSLFNKVALILKRLRPKNNITYYPYIIYKIMCSILNDGVRKARILECIHLQSNSTMQFIDDLYKQVCDEIDELKHMFTDKHEYDFLL